MSTAIRIGFAVLSRWVMASFASETRSPGPMAFMSLVQVSLWSFAGDTAGALWI